MLPPKDLPKGVILEERCVVDVPLIPEEDIDRVPFRQSDEPECQGGKNNRDKDETASKRYTIGATAPSHHKLSYHFSLSRWS
jgi:hypothetical protein